MGSLYELEGLGFRVLGLGFRRLANYQGRSAIVPTLQKMGLRIGDCLLGYMRIGVWAVFGKFWIQGLEIFLEVLLEIMQGIFFEPPSS